MKKKSGGNKKGKSKQLIINVETSGKEKQKV